MVNSPSVSSPSRTHWLNLFVGIVVVLACLLKLINVFNGQVHSDTNFYLNIGTNFMDHNALTPLMWRLDPTWNIVAGSGSGYAVIIVALWVKWFGLTVTSGHMLMYLVGLLTLPIIYLLLKTWWNGQAALWGLLFFVLSSTFADDFYARMDALNILACTAILLLHATAVKTNRNILHFLVGIALVLALEIHVLAGLYIGAIGFYHLVMHISALRKAKKLWLITPAIFYGLGLGIALAIYAIIHILPNPSIYFLIPTSCNICITRSVGNEVARWSLYFLHQVFLLGILLPGVGIVCLRRNSADIHLLLLLIGGFISMFLLSPPGLLPYSGMLLPLFAMGAAALMADLKTLLGSNKSKAQRSYRLLQTLCMMSVAGTLVVRVSQTSFTNQREFAGLVNVDAMKNIDLINADPQYYIDAIKYIRANVPRDAVIMGYPTYYADLLDYHQFLSYHDGDLYGIIIRKETFLSFWKREKPVIFIGKATADPDLVSYMNFQGGFDEINPDLWIEKSYLDSIIKPKS